MWHVQRAASNFKLVYSFQTSLESHKGHINPEVSGMTKKKKSRSEERRRKQGLRKPFSMVMWNGQEEPEEKGCAPKELEKKRFKHHE